MEKDNNFDTKNHIGYNETEDNTMNTRNTLIHIQISVLKKYLVKRGVKNC